MDTGSATKAPPPSTPTPDSRFKFMGYHKCVVICDLPPFPPPPIKDKDRSQQAFTLCCKRPKGSAPELACCDKEVIWVSPDHRPAFIHYLRKVMEILYADLAIEFAKKELWARHEVLSQSKMCIEVITKRQDGMCVTNNQKSSVNEKERVGNLRTEDDEQTNGKMRNKAFKEEEGFRQGEEDKKRMSGIMKIGSERANNRNNNRGSREMEEQKGTEQIRSNEQNTPHQNGEDEKKQLSESKKKDDPGAGKPGLTKTKSMRGYHFSSIIANRPYVGRAPRPSISMPDDFVLDLDGITADDDTSGEQYEVLTDSGKTVQVNGARGDWVEGKQPSEHRQQVEGKCESIPEGDTSPAQSTQNANSNEGDTSEWTMKKRPDKPAEAQQSKQKEKRITLHNHRDRRKKKDDEGRHVIHSENQMEGMNKMESGEGIRGLVLGSRPEGEPRAATMDETEFIEALKRSEAEGRKRSERVKSINLKEYSLSPLTYLKEDKKAKYEANESHDQTDWVDDKLATKCALCNSTFSIAKRRHHCRSCGNIFCGTCSAYKLALPSGKKPARVCMTCHDKRSKTT